MPDDRDRPSDRAGTTTEMSDLIKMEAVEP